MKISDFSEIFIPRLWGDIDVEGVGIGDANYSLGFFHQFCSHFFLHLSKHKWEKQECEHNAAMILN
jgi:hypothetical protein